MIGRGGCSLIFLSISNGFKHLWDCFLRICFVSKSTLHSLQTMDQTFLHKLNGFEKRWPSSCLSLIYFFHTQKTFGEYWQPGEVKTGLDRLVSGVIFGRQQFVYQPFIVSPGRDLYSKWTACLLVRTKAAHSSHQRPQELNGTFTDTKTAQNSFQSAVTKKPFYSALSAFCILYFVARLDIIHCD